MASTLSNWLRRAVGACAVWLELRPTYSTSKGLVRLISNVTEDCATPGQRKIVVISDDPSRSG
jgi:hypothetical protein